LESRLSAVQAQTALLFFRSVALVTVRRQDGFDVVKITGAFTLRLLVRQYELGDQAGGHAHGKKSQVAHE
jgi:hypothetical protein